MTKLIYLFISSLFLLPTFAQDSEGTSNLEVRENRNLRDPGDRRPQRRQRRRARRDRFIRVGDIVLNVDRDSVRAEVINIERNGTYALRFLEGTLRGRIGSNWSRESLAVTRGCGIDFCAGDQALNIDRDSALVEVVGVMQNDLYVLKFMEGTLRGRKGARWSSAKLAELSGCTNEGYCVGDTTYNIDRDSVQAQVVGIQQDDRVVLKFMEGTLAGRKGANWTANSLANTYVCGVRFCPGDFAYNISRDYSRVKILAVDSLNRYVLEFLDGPLAGRKGAKWQEESLAPMNPRGGRGRGRGRGRSQGRQ